jgi:tRNA(Ile)-lysidine synthase
MHFLRGSGLAGLRGMAPRSLFGDPPLALIRPLLFVSRADIEAFCRQQDLQPRLDRSNLDHTYFRNRLRYQVLPVLEECVPGVRRRLCQLAELVAGDHELLQVMLDELWPTLLIEAGDEALALDLAAWRDLPLGLRRRVLRRAAHQLRPDLRDLGFVQVEAARRIAEMGTTGARVSLPGRLSLTISYERLWISDADFAPTPPTAWPVLSPGAVVSLRIPGATLLPGDWLLEASFRSATDKVRAAARQNDNPWRAFLDADRAGTDLVLRTRLPGESFQPLGMAGRTASLSDFMINLCIPSAWRDQVPILARAAVPFSGPGEILWIAGWRLDERVCVRSTTSRVLRLVFRRPAELP